MKREDAIIKLRNAIRESYQARDLWLSQEKNKLWIESERIGKDIEALRKQQSALENNLSRATDDDLKSFHLLYFGTEGKISND